MGRKKDFEFIVPPNEEPISYFPDYISFTIAHYALTDVIEELTASKAKDIIVTKVDDNLVVKYKPSWRK